MTLTSRRFSQKFSEISDSANISGKVDKGFHWHRFRRVNRSFGGDGDRISGSYNLISSSEIEAGRVCHLRIVLVSRRTADVIDHICYN